MKTTIVIVGGGTAGWLTAGIIAARHCYNDQESSAVEIMLVESPDVKNLGVGEGTWPTMRDTLRQMGISEKTFLSCCDASFKQASKFVGWGQGKQDFYYHPFSPPIGYNTANTAEQWLATEQGQNFESWICGQGSICDQNLAPKLSGTPDYAFNLNYGYHLNAAKFVDMLHKHCTEVLNVKYIQGHVEQVESHDNGDIAALNLKNGQQLKGDLFIDCSGFTARLIGQHYKIPMKSQRHILFNDTALALQVDHTNDQVPVASCTIATAQKNGWIWDIALQSRRGIGHVFSSDFTSLDQAETALMNYVKADPLLSTSSLTPKKISFTPGYREVFWFKNCVAIGVSAGFVEPLEATALVLVEKSAEWLSQQLPKNRRAISVLSKRFNQLTSSRWQEIIDFLKLHYVLSQREDSDYWQRHRQIDSIPVSLQDSIALWQTQPPWLYETNQRFELFSSASKQYVLFGMGGNAADWQNNLIPKQEIERVKRLRRENRHFIEKCLASLPTNRQYMMAK